MVNTFLDAVTQALYTAFGENYAYYVENVEQHAKKPCFRAGMINPAIRSVSPNRYYREMPVVIHYFSNSGESIGEVKNIWEVNEMLIEAMEYLHVQDCIFRGENIESQITEGVLQFFITYSFYTSIVNDTETMETYEQKTDII